MTLSERINELFQKFNVNLKTEEIEVNLEAQAVLDNGTIIYTDADSFDEGAEVYILNEEGEKIPLPEGEYELEDGSKMSVGEGGRIARAPRRGGEGEGEGEGGDSRIGEGGNAPKSGRDSRRDPVKKDPPKREPPKKDPPKNQAPVKKKKSAQEMLEVESKKEEFNEVEVMEMLVERFPDLDKEMAAAIASAVAEIYKPEVEVIDAEDEEEMVHTPEHKEEDKVYSEQEQLVTELKAQLESQEAELTELKTQAASEGVKRVKSTARKTEPVDLTTLSTEERIKALYNQFNK